MLRRLYDSSPSASRCMLPWLAADLVDDQAARDQLFELLETRHEPESPHTAAIWRLFHEAINRDGGRSLDLPAIAEQRQHFHPSEVWLLDFIVGMFLQKHGRPLEAREFLQRAVEDQFISDSTAPVARDAIRKLDQDANKPKADAKAKASSEGGGGVSHAQLRFGTGLGMRMVDTWGLTPRIPFSGCQGLNGVSRISECAGSRRAAQA